MDLRSLHVLAESSTGRLWRGEDETLQKRYLVKELDDECKGVDVHVQRLAKEAEFLKNVEHERILAVHNFDESGILILEDVQCTLAQLIERHGPLQNDQVVNVLTECLEALEFLHGNRYAHGMLSADNVFVDPSGHVKLGDFVGYRYESERPVFDRKLKLRYQAPEVIDNSFGDCRPVSDLYCLGFLALEMIAGAQFPQLFGFNPQGQAPKWMYWHSNPDVALSDWRAAIPQVSNALADMVDGLIAKKPQDRKFQKSRDLKESLTRAGQNSRRVLPMFDKKKRRRKPSNLVRVPTRRVGPTLILKPRQGNGPSHRFPPNRPVVVSRNTEDGPILSVPDPSVGVRHALLACQSSHWHVYSLHHPSGTFHNGQKVGTEKRLSRDDDVRFGNVAYQVDLELEGTGIIRQYDLLNRIHAGKGGEVYKAKSLRPGEQNRTVVLKLLPRGFNLDRNQIRRFLRAVPEAGRLRHPNVVKIHKAGMTRRDDTSYWYLAMEHMGGGSLRDKIRQLRRPIPPETVVRFGLDIASALKAASKQGLLHRNINPSCILFDPQGNAKLGDFLLARGEVFQTMHDITQGKLRAGDFHYQAPEVLLGKSNLTGACDLFGLAACMFEALTGQLPIDKQLSVAETITRMCKLEWPLPSTLNPTLPRGWDDFMKQALAREPDKRFANVDAFAAALQNLLPRPSPQLQ